MSEALYFYDVCTSVCLSIHLLFPWCLWRALMDFLQTFVDKDELVRFWGEKVKCAATNHGAQWAEAYRAAAFISQMWFLIPNHQCRSIEGKLFDWRMIAVAAVVLFTHHSLHWDWNMIRQCCVPQWATTRGCCGIVYAAVLTNSWLMHGAKQKISKWKYLKTDEHENTKNSPVIDEGSPYQHGVCTVNAVVIVDRLGWKVIWRTWTAVLTVMSLWPRYIGC